MYRQVFALLFALTAFSPWADTFAYPPDNAAVLYYKHMVNFTKPDDLLSDQMAKAINGEIEVSREVQQVLQTASTIPTCDWGLDYSRGFALEMPHLGNMREFTYILLADAQWKNQQGNHQDAVDTCLATLRMAGHVGDETLISYLVGTAMSTKTYGVIEDILSSMSPETSFLTKLQGELKQPQYNTLEIRTPLLNESRYLSEEILRMSDTKKELIEQMQGSEEIRKDLPALLKADQNFLRLSADYYQDFFKQYMKILDQPYAKALQALDALAGKPQEDYKAGKKEAFAAVILTPAVTKVYNTDIRRRTHTNALFAAIDLYQICAKEGSLPKELPASAPVDLFSGKPFVYELTADGFVLRCNEKDRDKDKIQEYTFQIAR
jgi:hypothetical protein